MILLKMQVMSLLKNLIQDFQNLQKKIMTDYRQLEILTESQTVNDSGLDSVLNTSGGKLGKHIIVENQLNSYEPKLMAQAIRTMMSKDKD